MELNAFTNLLNYQVQVEQKEIGKVADFIDINRWTLLSLVSRRGIWPFTKRFQIAIEQIDEIDQENRQITLGLKKENLEDPTEDQIIQIRKSIANFFRWGTYRHRYYYKIPANWNAVNVRAENDFYSAPQGVETTSRQTSAIRLKSVIDYLVHTRDNEFVRVKDFVLDFDQNAEKIRYLIVGSGQNKAFLPIDWIEYINTDEERMDVFKSQKMLLNGPYSMTI